MYEIYHSRDFSDKLLVKTGVKTSEQSENK